MRQACFQVVALLLFPLMALAQEPPVVAEVVLEPTGGPCQPPSELCDPDDPEPYILYLGETMEFTATPLDHEGNRVFGRLVVWGTSDEEIATVTPDEDLGTRDITAVVEAVGLGIEWPPCDPDDPEPCEPEGPEDPEDPEEPEEPEDPEDPDPIEIEPCEPDEVDDPPEPADPTEVVAFVTICATAVNLIGENVTAKVVVMVVPPELPIDPDTLYDPVSTVVPEDETVSIAEDFRNGVLPPRCDLQSAPNAWGPAWDRDSYPHEVLLLLGAQTRGDATYHVSLLGRNTQCRAAGDGVIECVDADDEGIPDEEAPSGEEYDLFYGIEPELVFDNWEWLYMPFFVDLNDVPSPFGDEFAEWRRMVNAARQTYLGAGYYWGMFWHMHDADVSGLTGWLISPDTPDGLKRKISWGWCMDATGNILATTSRDNRLEIERRFIGSDRWHWHGTETHLELQPHVPFSSPFPVGSVQIPAEDHETAIEYTDGLYYTADPGDIDMHWLPNMTRWDIAASPVIVKRPAVVPTVGLTYVFEVLLYGKLHMQDHVDARMGSEIGLVADRETGEPLDRGSGGSIRETRFLADRVVRLRGWDEDVRAVVARVTDADFANTNEFATYWLGDPNAIELWAEPVDIEEYRAPEYDERQYQACLIRVARDGDDPADCDGPDPAEEGIAPEPDEFCPSGFTFRLEDGEAVCRRVTPLEIFDITDGDRGGAEVQTRAARILCRFQGICPHLDPDPPDPDRRRQ